MSVSYVYRDRLVELALQAGAMMESMRSELTAALKEGRPSQVITAADEAISAMLRAEFGDTLLEEESIDLLDDDEVRRTMAHGQRILADPIDGTSSYALGMGTEGVTIGVYDDGVPVAGVIYCPRIASPYAEDDDVPEGILVYAERLDGVYVGYSRKGDRPAKPLSSAPVELNLTSKGAFFEPPYNFFSEYMPQAPIKPYHTHACVATVLDMARGKICGTFFMDALWDKAGAMAIWRACGLVAINIETGALLTRLEPDNYQRDPAKKWRIVAPHLVCHPANVQALCAHLHDRRGHPLQIPGYC